MLSEVPEGWQISTLGEVCSPKQHPTIQKTKFTSEGYPVYGANGQIGFFSDYTHGERTLAITCRGATCGTINVVPPKSYITGNAMALDSLDESAVAFDFLNHYLRHFGVDACITGSAQPQITRSSLLPVELALPPLNEQHRIAEILASVDATIQATQAVIEQAERLKRGLMEELLTGGLGSEAIERGEVPDGWKSSSIGALTELQNGYGFKSKDWAPDGLPIIRIQNLNGGGDFNYFNGKYDEKYLVEKGDLLFCWSGSRGTSFGARYWTQEKGLLNQHIFKCIPKDGVEKAFLYYLLDWMTVAIEKEAHGGAGLAHIKKSEMVAFSCCIPPVSEQRRIAEVLSDFDDFIAAQKAIVEQQLCAKRGLMDDLLTGKVRTV